MFDPQANVADFVNYESHRVVRAAPITTIYNDSCVGIGPKLRSFVFDPKGKPTPAIGWWLICYEDGYVSFCPPDSFEKGYRKSKNETTFAGEHQGLPVAGYRPQSGDNVAIVNENKRLEETVLRQFDVLAQISDVDKRWLAIGRTNLEQAFMAMNRAVFKPGRVEL